MFAEYSAFLNNCGEGVTSQALFLSFLNGSDPGCGHSIPQLPLPLSFLLRSHHLLKGKRVAALPAVAETTGSGEQFQASCSQGSRGDETECFPSRVLRDTHGPSLCKDRREHGGDMTRLCWAALSHLSVWLSHQELPM